MKTKKWDGIFLKKRYLTVFFIYSIIYLLIIPSSGYPQDNQINKKGALVVVGDANLTYASYFFVLPPDWSPSLDPHTLILTDKIGFWAGMHRDNNAYIRIAPNKKDSGKNLANYVDSVIENARAKPECSIQKYASFEPSITYPYEAYLYKNRFKTDQFELDVYLDLPGYFIIFGLMVNGKNEDCITSYIEDFDKIISSFRWILGLSDKEISDMFEKGS